MEKKIKGSNLIIAMIMMVGLFAKVNVQAQDRQETKAIYPTFSPTFNSKSGILEWAKKELGYTISDTINLSVGDVDVFALFWNYASGAPRQFIFVFKHDKKMDGDEWILFCTRNTNTGKVYAESNQDSKEIIFKSKSGKVLMTLPFEGLSLKFNE